MFNYLIQALLREQESGELTQAEVIVENQVSKSASKILSSCLQMRKYYCRKYPHDFVSVIARW